MHPRLPPFLPPLPSQQFDFQHRFLMTWTQRPADKTPTAQGGIMTGEDIWSTIFLISKGCSRKRPGEQVRLLDPRNNHFAASARAHKNRPVGGFCHPLSRVRELGKPASLSLCSFLLAHHPLGFSPSSLALTAPPPRSSSLSFSSPGFRFRSSSVCARIRSEYVRFPAWY